MPYKYYKFICLFCKKEFLNRDWNRKFCSRKCADKECSLKLKGKKPKNYELWNKKGINTRFKNGSKGYNLYDFEKKKLIELYIEKRLSCEKIAKMVGCGISTVHYNLKRFDIQRRPMGVNCYGMNISQFDDVRKKLSENHWSHKENAEEIKRKAIESRKWYRGSKHCRWKGGRSLCQSCGKNTSGRKCEFCRNCLRGKNHWNFKEIKPLCKGCSKRTKDSRTEYCINCYVGKNTFTWRGGVSKFPYSFDFNEKLKSKIKRRDNFKCQECDLNQKESKLKYNTDLAVHHIDYNKWNNNEANLITLCNSCHAKTNFHMYGWQVYFQERMMGLI